MAELPSFTELVAQIAYMEDNKEEIKCINNIQIELMWSNFQALQKQGFTRKEAFELVKARGGVM
jgi:hypothetical protein